VRVCILGAGGLGSVLAACLAESGTDVALIGRLAHVSEISSHGLEVSGIRGTRRIRDRIEAVSKPDALSGEFDFLFLTVKADNTGNALDSASGLRERIGTAVSFQNAFGKNAALVEWLGPDRVVGGATFESGELLAPGQVRHAATATTTAYFGELAHHGPRSDDSARIAALVSIFDRAGLRAAHARFIEEVESEKLIQVSLAAAWSISTAGMLPGACMAETFMIPEAAAHYVELAKELIALHRAMGFSPADYFAPYSQLCELEVDPFETSVEKLRKVGVSLYQRGILGRPSMHNDLLRVRPLEVEHNIGELLRIASRLDVPTPALTASYRIIKTLERLVS
jgi:2-dehydropantoate 2-reductase